VDEGRVDWTRDDLHGVCVAAISPDILEVAPPVGHHALPAKQHFGGERRLEPAMEVDHHLRDALLARFCLALVCGETELTANRRLNAGAVENFAFDFGSRQRFRAHRLDAKFVLVLGAEVFDAAHGDAAAGDEGLLGGDQAFGTPNEFRPLRPLPVPKHDR